MRWRYVLPGLCKQLLAGAACCALAVGTAHAQTQLTSGFGSYRATGVPCPAPQYPAPCEQAPTATTPTPSQTPTTPETPAPAPAPSAESTAPSGAFAAESGLAVGGGGFSSAAGYVESAIPVTQFRLRYDSMYDNNRPDRADFFYPKCGCFRAPGPLFDPKARGPVQPNETRVDFQELRSYFEYAFCPRFSTFLDLPERWVNPDVNANAEGFGDVDFGAKYAFIYGVDRVATAQVRAFAPSGDPGLGLGRGAWWIEPSLLVYQKLADRLFLEAELSDYVPIAAHDGYAGNVLRYGVAVSYLAYNAPSFRVIPVTELVGWTVLSGSETVFADVNNMTQDASGDTIVNAKVGVRLGFGELVEPGMLSRSDLYVGYGRALTGEFWYKDMFRIEYRVRF